MLTIRVKLYKLCIPSLCHGTLQRYPTQIQIDKNDEHEEADVIGSIHLHIQEFVVRVIFYVLHRA